VITFIVSLFIIPIGKYIHAITLGKDTTDCMVTYIRDYYPSWEMYSFKDSWGYHIDKRWVANEYMPSLGIVNGCIHNSDSIGLNLINAQYCYTTLAIETLIH